MVKYGTGISDGNVYGVDAGHGVFVICMAVFATVAPTPVDTLPLYL